MYVYCIGTSSYLRKTVTRRWQAVVMQTFVTFKCCKRKEKKYYYLQGYYAFLPSIQIYE